VEGSDGWLFLREELEHIGAGRFWGSDAAAGSRSADAADADPLPAIVDFHEQLRKRGIALIMVPIPPKALIYADRLLDGASETIGLELSAPHREFYELLSRSGIRVIDLVPSMVAERRQSRVYCKTDTHYAGAGLSLASAKIVEEIRTLGGYEFGSKQPYAIQPREVSILGDLALMQGQEGISETITVPEVQAPASHRPLVSARESSILLLGDSHTLVFSMGGDLHATGAGLGENMAARLGFPIDRIGVRGSGATPSRIALFQRSRQYPEYLDSKKVIVWCFAAREFTGTGGWRKIPVAPE
jgi:alginate O-acetyltransferase complex protein AlgJ